MGEHNKKVNILGTGYTVEFLTEKEDERLKDLGGFCDFYTKEIVIDCDSSDANIGDYKAFMNASLRHEIVHAFLYESGLAYNSFNCDNRAWAMNEEMVDWLAIQGHKIYNAWKEVDAV